MCTEEANGLQRAPRSCYLVIKFTCHYIYFLISSFIGDVFSLTKSPKDDVIPCDALIISGSAVVNEATLTGERYYMIIN
jgi:hypothetical protein